MKNYKKYTRVSVFVLSLIGLLQHCSPKKTTTEAVKATSVATALAGEYYTEADFQSVEKVDVHVHIRRDDASLIEQAKADNVHLLNINVNSPSSPPVEEQQALAIKQIKAFPDQVAYATAFSVKQFNDPAWEKQTLAYLKDSFAKGAVAVKTWKNIGMELKDKQGHFVMIDHERFDTILDYLAKHQITWLSHQGEPKNCWLPLEQMTVAGDKQYFSEHPQYHMYLHPEYPSYEAQIKARDHMVEKHPDLKVVSVHLASLEWSVAELAKRLDKYPNLAVDMAARISHLQHQAQTDWQAVHDFFIHYQDRLLYGTDIVIRPGEKEDPAAVKKQVHQTWLADWNFFTSEAPLSNDSKAEFKGLHLPREVVDKIYRKNARQWIPGIIKEADKIQE